ncbi:MAG: hypothetical protein HQ521_11920 [Bacteroidetes bacterium]|nr:hypothetical protein [Bacteroidota bacterium]
MFNKIISISFVVVANILLLANLVIPHHHHESEICVDVSHCESDNVKHDDSSTKHDHDHDSTSKTDHCALNQVYIVATDNVKQDYSSFIFSCSNYELSDYLALLFHDESQESQLDITFNEYHYSLNSYYNFISTSKGLRAPPIV